MIEYETFRILEPENIYDEWMLNKYWLFGNWHLGKLVGPQTIQVRKGFFETYKLQLEKVFGILNIENKKDQCSNSI